MAIAVSVVLHVLLITFGWIGARMPEVSRPRQQIIVLQPPAESPHAVEMRYQTGRRPDGETGSDRLGERRSPEIEQPRPERPAIIPPRRRLPEPPPDTGVAPTPNDEPP